MSHSKEYGVTASRHYLSERQIDKFRYLANWLYSEGYRIQHNGDCKGGDEALGQHWKTAFPDTKLYGHPPIVSTLRAYQTFSVMWPVKPYLDRNDDIVNESELIVACPAGPEALRSGTWSTVRYARGQIKAGKLKALFIIMPDGTLTMEGEGVEFPTTIPRRPRRTTAKQILVRDFNWRVGNIRRLSLFSGLSPIAAYTLHGIAAYELDFQTRAHKARLEYLDATPEDRYTKGLTADSVTTAAFECAKRQNAEALQYDAHGKSNTGDGGATGEAVPLDLHRHGERR